MSTATLERPTTVRPASEVPHLSPSIAKILLARSPMHAWDAHRLGGNHRSEPTEAMTRGLILDAMMFGCGPKIVPIDAPDWRSKAAQDARRLAYANNQIPVLTSKLVEYHRTTHHWQAQLADLGIAFDGVTGESQKKLTWNDGGTPCKGILDHLILGDDDATIYDLKTVDDAGDEGLARAFVNLGHDVQYAAYMDGVQFCYPRLAGRVRMLFLVCETSRPYGVRVVEPAGSMRQLGSWKWRAAVKTWGECLRDDRFPGYSAQVARVEAKPWQLDAAMPEGDFDAENL